MHHDSEVDLLIFVRNLLRDRMSRVAEFEAVEEAVTGDLEEVYRLGAILNSLRS